VALRGAALVAAALVVVTAVVQMAIVAKAAEAVAESHARCIKNAQRFKGNPLKRLK
jgi:type III secretory pathway component EscV